MIKDSLQFSAAWRMIDQYIYYHRHLFENEPYCPNYVIMDLAEKYRGLTEWVLDDLYY